MVEDSAFTTAAPTPWSPPDTLYAWLSNLPPAWRYVITVSNADFPVRACVSIGIPRPLSVTTTLPSDLIVISMRSQKPAIASSIELSTIS